MKEFFEGYYYKHQKGDETLCIIAGKAGTSRFIQVITEKQAWQVPFTEGNKFTTGGIRLAIETPELSLKGEIRYENLTPLGTDIMGPFRFFSMECSHGVISMGHRLSGKVELNGKTIDFTGGKGYIEMDKGRSFPSAYTWVQANDFADALQEDCSIMAAVAKIPFFGLHFRGCAPFITREKNTALQLIEACVYLNAAAGALFCGRESIVWKLKLRAEADTGFGRL